MFSNYFKLAWRHLLRHKILSLINIGSLAIGISASLVIYMIVHYDTSFEKLQADGDRIYRVVYSEMYNAQQNYSANGSFAMSNAIRQEVPGIEVNAFMDVDRWCVITPQQGSENTTFENQEVLFTDSRYFKLIKQQWLAGAEAMNEPYTAVLTASAARKYFPGVAMNAIPGRSFIFGDSTRVNVTGVVADQQGRTDFNFPVLMSLATERAMNKFPEGVYHWGSSSSSWQLFVKLSPGVSVEATAQKLTDLYRRNTQYGERSTYYLQPLRDLHMNLTYEVWMHRQADQKTLLGLELTALFLLALGCINFVNLKTAQASDRAREIGVRKVMGSSRASLVRQFLGESLLMTVLATLLSIALVPLVLRLFQNFIPEDISFRMLFEPSVITFLLALVLTVSLLAGLYPAFVLSRFRPVLVLKNQVYNKAGKNILRQALTVVQFAVALVFIIGTLVVGQQTRYALAQQLKQKKGVVLRAWGNFNKDQYAFADRLRQLPGVKTVGRSDGPPVAVAGHASGDVSVLVNKEKVNVWADDRDADTAYLGIYGLQLVAGRNFLPGDTTREVLVNEAFVRKAGFRNAQEAIGQLVGSGSRPIAGVLKDFHHKSVKTAIEPLIVRCNSANFHSYDILLQNGDGALWQQTIHSMDQLAATMYPDKKFFHAFYDDEVGRLYEYERSLSTLLSWATGLMILVSCLGLLGFSIQTTTQRTKEIGIRKILGASVAGIMVLFTRDVLRLVFLALLLASPLAWYAMDKWLEGYAYSTGIQWWVFAAAGAGALLIGMLTVSFHSLKAALMNPVRAIRTE